MTRAKRTKRSQVRKPAPSTAPTSEGQRLLITRPESLSDIAKRVGCSKALVGYWRAGERLPNHEHRLALASVYAVPAESWDRAPGTTAPEQVEDDASDRSTLEAVDGQIVALYRLQRTGGLSAPARLKLADTLGKLLALKARLERDRELLEDRVVRDHPLWKRMRETLVEVLRPYPDAARAAAVALQQLGI